MKTFSTTRESGEFERVDAHVRRSSEIIPRALEAVTGELTLHSVLCAIPAEFVDALGARAVSVYALATDQRTLELVAQCGFEALAGPPRRLDIGDSVPAARAVRQRTIQVMGEASALNEQGPLAPPPSEESMLFSIPLLGAQRVFGAVNVEFSGPPEPEDVGEIAVLGELFGAALELCLLRRARVELNERQRRQAEMSPGSRRGHFATTDGRSHPRRGK